MVSICSFISWICCSDLTMEIVRYRLIGPQSHSVLAETLEAATDCAVRIMMLSTYQKLRASKIDLNFTLNNCVLCFSFLRT